VSSTAIVQLQKKEEAKFICSACGADRCCDCHAPAIPKAQQAIEALKANPEKSNHAIAKEIGADKVTVDRARKKLEATGDMSPVTERVGLDNTTRKVPSSKPEPEPEIAPAVSYLDKPWQAVDPNEGEAAELEEDTWPPDDWPTITKVEVEAVLKKIIGWRFLYPPFNDARMPYIKDGDVEFCDLVEEATDALRILSYPSESWDEAVDAKIEARREAERKAQAEAKAAKKKRLAA